MKYEESEKESVIQNQHVDYVTSAVKAMLGLVPFAGSLLAELAGTIIPNQRIDRLAKFAAELEKRLAKLDEEFVRAKLTDENFTDLMEEGMRQAARSVSDERRQYLASLLTNGIAASDVSFIESKHLLRILGDLNDIEVLWLRFYLVATQFGDNEFRQKHSSVFKPLPVYPRGSDQATLDNYALRVSYKRHLTELGLLEAIYETDMRNNLPVFDTSTGAMKVKSHQITLLGKLLLRQISLTTHGGS